MISRAPASRVGRCCSGERAHAIALSSLAPNGSCRLPSSKSGGSFQLRRLQGASLVRGDSAASSLWTDFIGSLRRKQIAGKRPISTAQTGETTTTTTTTAARAGRKEAIYSLLDRINAQESELEKLLDELDLFDDYHGILSHDSPAELEQVFSAAVGHRNDHALARYVRSVRQQFGDVLPEGILTPAELRLYTRLYGSPISWSAEMEDDADDAGDADLDSVATKPAGGDGTRLFRRDRRGGWEEIEEFRRQAAGVAEAAETTLEAAEQRLGRIMLEQVDEDGDDAFSDDRPRMHPLTAAGKSSTEPSTVFMPKDTLTEPVAAILSNFSNKHIAEAAHRTFGGARLPQSTTTAPPSAQLPQLPIPLAASQHFMGEMEANSFLAVLYPGIYASVLNILVEVRKRLGHKWIRQLISQEGGPNVLDAGGGGAGILAWRDVLRAEWESILDSRGGRPGSQPVPLGRATVLTGSETLKARASAILENTTFLPRLPDYVHVRDTPTLDDERQPPRRKQYDVIIAPHTILGIEDEHMRKQHVENLWALLNPNGGVLLMLEKGRPRGFEAIAGAREMLLKRHIATTSGNNDGTVSTAYEGLTESPSSERYVAKETGMIIAPCTNHAKCPMYTVPGHSTARRDFCHFQQRYIRPAFLQRILGARDRNHEDVKFSYLAVQRGMDLRQTDGILQGRDASDAAFAGYEHLGEGGEQADAVVTDVSDSPPPFHTLSLPRALYPPMKRRGHVILDLCTPAGKIERWTVPRSFSQQAYRDARKAQWGDLWALGAKTRIARNLALGDKHGEGKKERLARRAAARAVLAQQADDNADVDGDSELGAAVAAAAAAAAVEEQTGPPYAARRKSVPSWKKYADKKKVRQASKKLSAGKLGADE